MTSPHQDAADLVARLEEERKLCAIMGDTTAHSFLGEISNLIEQQAKAMSEAEVERDRQTGFVQKLQTALAFWMPGVDLRLDEATRELAADDACLLAGGIGERDIPCWGEGMLERALAAEARLAEAMGVIERDIEALTEADTQIEYLHDKFKPTGSGMNALARIDIALTAARAYAAKEKA